MVRHDAESLAWDGYGAHGTLGGEVFLFRALPWTWVA
jgi:hypothetical protein